MLRQLQFLNDLTHKKVRYEDLYPLLNLPFSSFAQELEQSLQQIYEQYLQTLFSLPEETLHSFLKLQMEEELVTTQRMEDEKSFLIRMYMKTSARNPIAFAREQFDSPMTLQAIQQIHNELMLGTSQDGKNNYEFRNEEKIVAEYKPGTEMRVIYNPPQPSEIKNCMLQMLPLFHYYSYENSFLNSFKLYALVGIIQPFQDGNSRVARVLQYGYLSKITELFFSHSWRQPTFYCTKQYAKNQLEYRNLIGEIALDRTTSAFDAWYQYNAEIVKQQLIENENELKQLKLLKNSRKR